MRIGITDSGLGGLSVCAALERRLARASLAQDVELLYLNAALEDHYAYNSMPNDETRLSAFDAFLGIVRDRYRPDILFIACNSLSVLYGRTSFASAGDLQVEGIVDTVKQQAMKSIEARPGGHVVVFATPTTVDSGVYGRFLRGALGDSTRVVEQACPGLPDAIANDHSGEECRALLREFVPQALDQFEQAPEQVTAVLGCTHYAYQEPVFASELRRYVADVQMVNPNPLAADAIASRIIGQGDGGRLTVRFLTRYTIPDLPMRSLPLYLGQSAPRTVTALLNFEQDVDLCGSLEQIRGWCP